MSDLILSIEEPGKAPREIAAKDGLSFGRHPENSCVLEDPKVSSRHARIVAEAGKLWIEDLGSSNKTKIDGGPALGKGERFALSGETRLRIGGTQIAAREAKPAPPPPSESPAATITAKTLNELPTPAEPKPPASPVPPKPSGIQYGEIEMGNFGGTVLGKNAQIGALAKEAGFRAARPRLVVAGEAHSEIADLGKHEFLIGRGSSGGAQDSAKPVDCAIPHGGVSSQHAKISFNGQRFFLEDLGSKNGTFLGGEMLAPNAPREIRPESHIRFGSVDCLFVVDADPEGKPVSPERYRAALNFLSASTQGLTRAQRERAEREAAEKNRHAGEILIANRVISVEQWTSALERGSIMQVAQKARLPQITRMTWLFVIVFSIALVAFLLWGPFQIWESLGAGK